MPVTLVLQTDETSPDFKIDRNCLKTEEEFYSYSRIVWVKEQCQDPVNAYLASLKYKSNKRIVLFKLDSEFGLERLLPVFTDKQPLVSVFYSENTKYGEQLVEPSNCNPSVFQDTNAVYHVLNASKVSSLQGLAFLRKAPQDAFVKYIQFNEKNDIVELAFDGFFNTFCVESMLNRMAQSNNATANGQNGADAYGNSDGDGENDCVATKLLYNVFGQSQAQDVSNTRQFGLNRDTSFEHVEVIVSCRFQDSDKCRRLLRLGSGIKAQEDAMHGINKRVPIVHLSTDIPLEEAVRMIQEKYEKTLKMQRREYVKIQSREKWSQQKLKNEKLKELELIKCEKCAALQEEASKFENEEFNLELSSSKLKKAQLQQNLGELITNSLFNGFDKPDTCTIEQEKGKLTLELDNLREPTRQVTSLCNQTTQMENP